MPPATTATPSVARPLRILYGLPSEGMGHATRSRVVVEYLLSQGHEVKVATSDRAAAYFEGFDILPIKGLHLKYKDGKVKKFDSVTMNLSPRMLMTNVKQMHRVKKEFFPDVCISDYDSFTYVFAKKHHLPILCLDNIQFCARCEIEVEIPRELKGDQDTCRRLTNMKAPGCDRYLVISIWPGKTIKPNTFKVPPILRDVILEAKPSVGKHVLVYQTSTSQTNLVPELKAVQMGVTFHVYGFNRNEEHDHVYLKSFSEQGFVDDLASCCAVITNGGHSLISEAIYLHKPLCCFPITGQFEQYLNASYVEKLGYGRCFPRFGSAAVAEFLNELPRYEAALAQYHQDGNQQTFAAVDCFLEEHGGPGPRSRSQSPPKCEKMCSPNPASPPSPTTGVF